MFTKNYKGKYLVFGSTTIYNTLIAFLLFFFRIFVCVLISLPLGAMVSLWSVIAAFRGHTNCLSVVFPFFDLLRIYIATLTTWDINLTT